MLCKLGIGCHWQRKVNIIYILVLLEVSAETQNIYLYADNDSHYKSLLRQKLTGIKCLESHGQQKLYENNLEIKCFVFMKLKYNELNYENRLSM